MFLLLLFGVFTCGLFSPGDWVEPSEIHVPLKAVDFVGNGRIIPSNFLMGKKMPSFYSMFKG